MIVKVQISLETTQPEPQVLIYNQDRSVMEILPLSKCPDLEAMMTDAGPLRRAYFHARIRDGSLLLGDRVDDPDW